MDLFQFTRSRRGGELIGIIVLAAGVTLAAALLTYHPNDSSAFYTSTSTTIANAIGYYGATVAWIFVGFFGFASLLFPGALLVIGWNRFWAKDLAYAHTKLMGFVVLALAVPALLDLWTGKIWIRGSLIPAGGYLGQEIGRVATSNLNASGAAIVLVTAVLIGLLLATRISLAVIFLAVQQRLMGSGRSISMHWARFTERRRKERMKEAVLRKHVEKEGPSLRLVPHGGVSPQPLTAAGGPVVREVRGAGRFQIRKVTKAELRKAAEALAASPDPFELYAAPSGRAAVDLGRAIATLPRRKPLIGGEPFEDPLDLDEPPSARRSGAAAVQGRLPLRRPKPAGRGERRASRGNDELPPIVLLTTGPKQDQINDDVHKKFLDIGRLIEERCREFSVEGEITAYHPGPVVTTFEFKPGPAVKYAKVVNLGDDLALALKAESIRIERISGSSTVGIEVPNRWRELITLRDIIDSDAFAQSQGLMTLALGKDIHGDPIATDLARMPHLLVAGATGAGKSVGLNSMIVSLLYKALPKQLRMLMIDPKMVELKIYEDIPHLLHPIVTDPKLASNALIWAVQEMENRYRTLAECGVRNVDQYNALLKDPDAHRRARKLDSEDDSPVPEPMQFIVIIIDEFADLMMVAPKDVEDSVTRLAQKARAVGIHLIVATQRPSVDVITGVIKANFPSRISYQVASKVDSRTILDTQGAEKLLGSGDMLFLPPGTARIRRIHGAYVSEKEINEVVDFVKKNQGEPKFLVEVTQSLDEKNGVDGIEYLEDPKYDDAVRVVLSTGQASASYLQRRLKLGYSRAARLIEIMEANGVVGPSQGSKPREILIRAEDYPSASGQI
ncbi:MAG TPA: DNA translocase FtsK [Thermoanaerobaculia bacterium]|nr:DNA translocase FtsK [Thermoanaerobaculia bacterium]